MVRLHYNKLDQLDFSLLICFTDVEASPPPFPSPGSPENFSLVPSPKPIMSPKVFKLNPPKRKALFNQLEGPSFEDKLNRLGKQKRPLEVRSIDDPDQCPDAKRMRGLDSAKGEYASYPEHKNIPQFGDVLEKDGPLFSQPERKPAVHASSGASTSNENAPLRKIKKAKKCAGQRRVHKSSSKSNDKQCTVTFECSEEVMKSLEKVYEESMVKKKEENIETKKPKEKKFVRCPSERKYLCEVCSKPDCNKCSNCL